MRGGNGSEVGEVGRGGGGGGGGYTYIVGEYISNEDKQREPNSLY